MASNALTRTTTGQHANYEGLASVVWLTAALCACAIGLYQHLPVYFWGVLVAAMLVMVAIRGPAGWRAEKRRDRMSNDGVEIFDSEQLGKAIQDVSYINHGPAWMRLLGASNREYKESIYLGRGFVWKAEHAIKTWEIQNEIVTPPPQPKGIRGQKWIQGLADQEENIALPTSHTKGNVQIYGTTGAGKTVFYKLLLKQAILRDEPIIVLDPKGDKDVVRVLKETCDEIGHPERFAMLHPGFPEDSIRLNLLANFSKPTELASRVAALLPNSKSSDTFSAFITNVLIYIVSGMLMVGEKVTLTGISSYVHNGTAELVTRCIIKHAEQNRPGWENEAKAYTKKAKDDDQRTRGLIAYYQDKLRYTKKSTEIEGLIDMTLHDRSHFEKMIVSLHPVLTFLTAGDLGPLLSPDPDDETDTRPITNLSRLIESNSVLYVGLDTLSDDKVGKAIANLLLADMAAFSGDRYNYTTRDTPVNLFCDEVSELMNYALIRVLNKARGSGVTTYLAAQTFSDYIIALGSKDGAHQATGNANTVITLRQQDPETQKEFLGVLPKVTMEKRDLTRSSSIEDRAVRGNKGNVSEKLSTTDIERIPGALLSDLPDLEYFARFPSGNIVKGRIPIV